MLIMLSMMGSVVTAGASGAASLGSLLFGRLANDFASWLEAFCKLKKALTSPEALSFLVSHLVSSCASFVMSFSASSA